MIRNEQTIKNIWVARNENGSLFIFFEGKPEKIETDGFWDEDGFMLTIDETLFPEVKWEDDEPSELVIKK